MNHKTQDPPHMTVAQWHTIDHLSQIRYAPTVCQRTTDGTVRVRIAKKLAACEWMTVEVTPDGHIRASNTPTRQYNRS